jgi:hypothetical protein
MASWDIVENSNARYIVVYSIFHNETTEDIQRWIKESDAVILEQGTRTSEPIGNTVNDMRARLKSINPLFKELERTKPLPVFTTDVSPKMSQNRLEDLLRIILSTGLAVDLGINIKELTKKPVTRREFITRGIRMGFDSFILFKLWPLLQTLSIEMPGKRSKLQEFMRQDIATSQEFLISMRSADVRDAINAIKFDAIARELIHETGKKPTILVYDFRPNHAMLPEFLRRPGSAMAYLSQRHLNFNVMTEEIPRLLRFDFNGRTWDLTQKTLELPKLGKPIELPKAKPKKEPEFSRRDFFKRIVRR